MLGRTGMVLGNAGTATGAYANAYRLDPKNRPVAWRHRAWLVTAFRVFVKIEWSPRRASARLAYEVDYECAP